MIGRGQDCDLKISDISVSRNHCQILFINGKFWLQDSGSKFGTLVLARSPAEVLPNTTVGVQVGRTLMIFRTKIEPTTELEPGSYLNKVEEKGRQEYKEVREKAFNKLKQRPRGLLKIDGKYDIKDFDYDEYLYSGQLNDITDNKLEN